MKQWEFNRRYVLQGVAAVAAAAAGGIPGLSKAAGDLKLWAAGIHKVGAKDWSAMSS